MSVEPQSCIADNGESENSLHIPKICHGVSFSFEILNLNETT
jgi:hypothetical protein